MTKLQQKSPMCAHSSILLGLFITLGMWTSNLQAGPAESLPPSPEKAARASAPPAPNADGQYGEKLKFKKNDLLDLSQKTTADLLNSGSSKQVFVKGKVLAVCPKKGCWMKVEAKEGPYFVSFKDYSFFVPTELIGKDVAIRGSFVPHKETVAEQKHLAEDARKSKAEIEAIKEDRETLRFIATGVQAL